MRPLLWIAWSIMAFTASAVLAWSLAQGPKTAFVPDATTAGHHQIEQACETCHTPFGGVKNDGCLTCHGEDLAASDDSHPKAKFTDPRNADRLVKLDALSCVTCHREHTPGMTRAMGVTRPDDYCQLCHEDVAKERPSHKELPFNGCASAGCHRYHDNRALYEDFLVEHANEPPLSEHPLVPHRTTLAAVRAHGRPPGAALPRDSHDAPATSRVDETILHEWHGTSHARSGVNCSGCHTNPATSDGSTAWVEKPGPRECATCHDGEVKGFFAGRHGMRLAAGLPAMTPAMARLPMKRDAAHKTLTCGTCHAAHRFDTRAAAVDACMTCHADSHTAAYTASPHFRLWTRERDGQAPAGSGVSCATCHLPREAHTDDGVQLVFVQHNQNGNLRPVDKMVRTVCLRCHGLAFSLDALADRALVAANFKGRPARHLESIEMALRRARTASK